MSRITLLLFVFILVGCGDSRTENTVIEPQISVSGPHRVEEGSLANFEVVSGDEVSVETSIEHLKLVSLGQNKFQFIAPNIVGNDEKELSFKVVASKSQSEHEYSVMVYAVETPSFSELPRGYPLESANIAKHATRPRDANGVPLFEKGGEFYYYPIQISKVAQVYYHYIKNKGLPARETSEFLAMADWLRDNCVYTEYGFCSWRSDLEYPAYRLPDDWTSAMAQGQAITVLLGAYAITQDDSYFDVMGDALGAFNYPVEEKGVSALFDGVNFYQEYGSETSPPHVLNGFFFALAGLYDVADLTGSTTARQAFQNGVDALAQVIHHFDLGFTSAYDHSHLRQIASAIGGGDGDSYHEIHMSQLAWLYAVSEEPFALEYLERFMLYDTGGVKSLPWLKDSSRKILSATASHSISPSTHGPEYVWDSNWTWKKYWSSNKQGTTLQLVLNNGSSDDDPIVLKGFRITALTEDTLPSRIGLYECGDDLPRTLLLDDILATSRTTEFSHEVGGHKSFTVVYEFEPLSLSCDTVVLELFSGDAGYYAIREVTPFIEQPEVIDQLLEAFSFLKEESH